MNQTGKGLDQVVNYGFGRLFESNYTAKIIVHNIAIVFLFLQHFCNFIYISVTPNKDGLNIVTQYSTFQQFTNQI
ncbi:hypothetical protein D3C72_1165170 [compost metagenome]